MLAHCTYSTSALAGNRVRAAPVSPSARVLHRIASSRHSGQRASAVGPDALQRVLDGIDALNCEDPRTTQVDGKPVPYELAYSQWLTGWVKALTSDGVPPLSDELLIVARGQHVQRWTSPRSSYPEGRTAYLKWREELKKFHARTVAGLMREAGYPDAAITKVETMINKRSLKEPEGQVVEDALCLVFLEHQFADLIAKEGDEKMVDIVRKTWKKMGPKGQAAALSLKCLTPDQLAIVGKALAPA